MAAAAIPTLGKVALGVGAGVGGQLLSNKLARAPAPTSQANQYAGQLTGISKALQDAGGDARRLGGGILSGGLAGADRGGRTLDAPEQYYRGILSGGTGRFAGAIAPEVGAINQLYRGATSSLDRGGVRGANREVAEADLARERASRSAGLIMSLRPGAAAALTDVAGQRTQAGLARAGLGASLYGQGGDLMSRAAGPLAALYGGELERMRIQQENAGGIGRSMGSFLFDLLRTGAGGTASGSVLNKTMPAGWQFPISVLPDRP